MSPTPHGRARLMALQQAAGNRAVAQLMRVDSTAVSVQRCGAGGCADCGTKQDKKAPAAAQGVEGQEEQEFPCQGAVQRAVADSARPPIVQRVATFSAGSVHQVNNLADALVGGGVVGFTPPVLNGNQILSTAQTRAALVRPTVKTSAAPPPGYPPGTPGGFDAEVDNVPTNTGSFDETVLAPGPWRVDTAQANIAAIVPALTMCTGPGITKFRAYGDPNDAAMLAANRRHEDHHANDHKTAFNATIAPWDAKLTAAKASGQKFHGATAADAEAALWAAMGGTPDQIADAFFNQCVALNNAFHATPAGGNVGAPTSPGARNSCAISWAHYHNPS